MNPTFRVYFNKKRNWLDVYLWEVHPSTFARWDAGRWAYFEVEDMDCKSGLFGSLHFVKSRLRIDTIVHELDHARAAWLWASRNAWTGKNEESIVVMGETLLWGFLKSLAASEPKARKWMKTLSEL